MASKDRFATVVKKMMQFKAEYQRKPCRQQNGHMVFGIHGAKQEIFQMN